MNDDKLQFTIVDDGDPRIYFLTGHTRFHVGGFHQLNRDDVFLDERERKIAIALLEYSLERLKSNVE